MLHYNHKRKKIIKERTIPLQWKELAVTTLTKEPNLATLVVEQHKCSMNLYCTKV